MRKLNILTNNKYNHLLENHIGPQIIDLFFLNQKRILSAKIIDKIENIETIEVVIIKIKVFKHYQNYFNRNIPYKISMFYLMKKYP